jgi:hypothetical protein
LQVAARAQALRFLDRLLPAPTWTARSRACGVCRTSIRALCRILNSKIKEKIH